MCVRIHTSKVFVDWFPTCLRSLPSLKHRLLHLFPHFLPCDTLCRGAHFDYLSLYYFLASLLCYSSLPPFPSRLITSFRDYYGGLQLQYFLHVPLPCFATRFLVALYSLLLSLLRLTLCCFSTSCPSCPTLPFAIAPTLLGLVGSGAA